MGFPAIRPAHTVLIGRPPATAEVATLRSAEPVARPRYFVSGREVSSVGMIDGKKAAKRSHPRGG